MASRYFRAGVGTVIYNDQGEVALFERNQHPLGIWQFQQGGIDHGEFPQQTLWRELSEETGLTSKELTVTAEFPYWLPYQDLNTFTDSAPPRIGQIHRWFFLKIKPHTVINLTLATDDEFKDFKWIGFENAISETSDHKRFVYEALFAFFKHEIIKTPR